MGANEKSCFGFLHEVSMRFQVMGHLLVLYLMWNGGKDLILDLNYETKSSLESLDADLSCLNKLDWEFALRRRTSMWQSTQRLMCRIRTDRERRFKSRE
ncbi:hypothetical protein JHK87_000741 [Glycine soja]|nr:hypothetical protein JHK87_000741 [Glycine soja]